MFDGRRRRIAWLFALVLLTELALLCCASASLSNHICPEDHRCAICECVRLGLNRAAVAPLAALALLCLLRVLTRRPVRQQGSPFASLLTRRVRFND